MRRYTICNGEGKILRSGVCTTASFEKKANDGEFIIEDFGNDVTQKVVDGKIVDKSPAEMAEEKIPDLKPVIKEKQPADITNEQWQNVLDRLSKLETEA